MGLKSRLCAIYIRVNARKKKMKNTPLMLSQHYEQLPFSFYPGKLSQSNFGMSPINHRWPKPTCLLSLSTTNPRFAYTTECSDEKFSFSPRPCILLCSCKVKNKQKKTADPSSFRHLGFHFGTRGTNPTQIELILFFLVGQPFPRTTKHRRNHACSLGREPNIFNFQFILNSLYNLCSEKLAYGIKKRTTTEVMFSSR